MISQINYLMYLFEKGSKGTLLGNWCAVSHSTSCIFIFLQCMQLSTQPVSINIIFLPKLEVYKAIRK